MIICRTMSILYIIQSAITEIDEEFQPEDINGFLQRPYDINDSPILFKKYNLRYHIKYSNKKEYSKHHNIFRFNLRKINKFNNVFARSEVFGINQFTGLDLETLTEYYTGFNQSMSKGVGEVFNRTDKDHVPASLDWRSTPGAVSPVREQGQCKESYVYSAVDQIEAQYGLLTWRSNKKNKIMFHLSGKQAFDCELTGSCATGGIPHMVMEALRDEGGVMLEEDYYIELTDWIAGVKYKCFTEPHKAIVQVTGATQLDVKDEDALKEAVAFYGPLSTSIYVSDSLRHYESGILDPVDCNGVANHAVLLIGYGEEDNIPYWIIKNSWGTKWGRSGFIYLIRGKKACSIGEYLATASVEIHHLKTTNSEKK